MSCDLAGGLAGAATHVIRSSSESCVLKPSVCRHVALPWGCGYNTFVKPCRGDALCCASWITGRMSRPIALPSNELCMKQELITFGYNLRLYNEEGSWRQRGMTESLLLLVLVSSFHTWNWWPPLIDIFWFKWKILWGHHRNSRKEEKEKWSNRKY